MHQISFSKALTIQRRVVHALLMRELITRFGRTGLGALWLILEPALFVLVHVAVIYAIKLDHVSNVPIIAFAIAGWSALMLWRNAANRSLQAISANIALMSHKNVKAIDIYLSRIFLDILGVTFAFIVLIIASLIAEQISIPYDLTKVINAWLMLCWFAVGLGITVGELGERSETFGRLWRVSSYLLMITSGTFFMVHWLPPNTREIILLLPMVHGVEWLRSGFFGDIVPTYEDPGYFAIWNLALTFIGLFLMKRSALKGYLK